MSAKPQERLDLTLGETAALFKRALRYVAPFKRQVLIKIGLSFASLLPGLVMPWPVKVVVDHVIGDVKIGQEVTRYPFFVEPFVHLLADASKPAILIGCVVVELVLLVLIGAFGSGLGERNVANTESAQGQDTATRTEQEANFGFSWAGGLLGFIDYNYSMRLTQRINHHYRSRLYERVQTLPMRTFDDERIGDAVYRVMYDTPSITQVAYKLLITPVTAPFNILIIMAVLMTTYGANSPVVLLSLLLLPMVLFVTLPLTGAVRKAGLMSRHAGAKTTTTIEEGLSNMAAVQSLGGGSREHARFDADSTASFAGYRRYIYALTVAILVAVVAGVFLVGYTALTLADEVIAGKISIGDLAVLWPYARLIGGSAILLGSTWLTLQNEASGIARVFWLMDQPNEEDPPGAKALPPVRESIKVEHVSFDYDAGRPVLSDVTFEAKRGELTAFVGPAGAGKTTLAYMIPRFLDPDKGRVLIDGQDIAQVTFASLRSQIAFVFQETTLFDATIADNLRIGNESATLADLTHAAQAAGIYEYIQSLPEGFETRLGRAGGKLSGGQKQRLSIARALLCKAPIMIFDEPTSALDPDTEARIVNVLETMARDRIVIVIAHRLSTVRNAGQILFLQDGRVVERGSHRALVATPHSAYGRFVQLQTYGAT